MNDFETVKKKIDLVDFLFREHPGGRIFKIGGAWRCNPAPCCGHNDCFTFGSDRFYCFSCGSRGDVLDFVQKTRGCTLRDAIAYVADIIHVSLNNKGGWPKSGSEIWGRSANDRCERAEVPISDEKRNEYCKLRRIAAEFYHEQLLKSADAIRYQTEVRRHSMAVLGECLVGFVGGNLIGHVQEMGIDPATLADVGLARFAGGRLREFLPRGCFVYPHFGGGRILYFSMKDSTGKFKFQIPKKRELADGRVFRYPDPAWICYGQDALENDGCWLVEGENDRIALLDAGEPHVAATIGNFCTPEVTAWLQKNAGGRTYYLAFDADDAGQKYTNHYVGVILGAGGKVRIVDV